MEIELIDFIAFGVAMIMCGVAIGIALCVWAGLKVVKGEEG